LRSATEGQPLRLSLQDFYQRVSIRENVDLPKAIFHARAAMSVLREAVSAGEFEDIQSQLPAEFRSLFELEPQTSAAPDRADREGAAANHPRRIRDIETQHPEVITPETKLMEAAQKMKKLDVGILPVCDGQQLVGMLTDRDVTIRATAEGRDPRTTPVREVMTPEVVCCYEDQEISEAARVMENKQIRRLPVMDRNDRLVGVVSLGDLAVRTQNERLAGEVLERVSEQQPVMAR
jgi:CBS domain-containing protein